MAKIYFATEIAKDTFLNLSNEYLGDPMRNFVQEIRLHQLNPIKNKQIQIDNNNCIFQTKHVRNVYSNPHHR